MALADDLLRVDGWPMMRARWAILMMACLVRLCCSTYRVVLSTCRALSLSEVMSQACAKLPAYVSGCRDKHQPYFY